MKGKQLLQRWNETPSSETEVQVLSPKVYHKG
jgi:hypothetical protein